MKRFLRILGIGFAMVAVALLLVLFSAGSWLETDTGRNLLQHELSKSLGMNASLNGEYSLQVFPSVHIAGSQLGLQDATVKLPLASLDSYEMRLALWPLLRKKVDIHKVVLREGTLDLDVLALREESRSDDSDQPFALPRVRSMDITGLKLVQSSNEFLIIEKLSLKNFAEGEPAPLHLAVRIPGSPSSGGLELEGTLQLRSSPLELMVVVDESSLNVDDQSWSLGQGQWIWDGSNELLSGNIEGHHLGFETGLKIGVQTGAITLIQLAAVVVSPDKRLLSGSLRLSPDSERWMIGDLKLDLDGHKLAGEGCFNLGGTPALQLQLRSQQLDLDALRELVPEDLLPSEQSNNSAELMSPIDLSIALQVEEVTIEGAVARDVRLLVGSEPACFLQESRPGDKTDGQLLE